jgi:hypothetical protein
VSRNDLHTQGQSIYSKKGNFKLFVKIILHIYIYVEIHTYIFWRFYNIYNLIYSKQNQEHTLHQLNKVRWPSFPNRFTRFSNLQCRTPLVSRPRENTNQLASRLSPPTQVIMLNIKNLYLNNSTRLLTRCKDFNSQV